MNQKNLYDDLSDKEWELIAPLALEKRVKSSRRPVHSKREMLNAIFYLLRSGCSWRDIPPWTAVQSQFRRWKKDGTFLKIHDFLRSRASW